MKIIHRKNITRHPVRSKKDDFCFCLVRCYIQESGVDATNGCAQQKLKLVALGFSHRLLECHSMSALCCCPAYSTQWLSLGKRIVYTALCCSLGQCSTCCCFMCNYPLDFSLRSLLFLLDGGYVGRVVEAKHTQWSLLDEKKGVTILHPAWRKEWR